MLLLALARSAPAGNIDLSQLQCPNVNILGADLITGICWSCLFPIKVAGISLFGGGDDAPSDAASNPVCACGGDLTKGRLPRVGFTLGLWQPARIIEVVRRPYCFPAMFGTQMADTAATAGGKYTIGGTTAHTPVPDSVNSGFYNWHYYVFPLLAVLEVMNVPDCNPDGYVDFDLAVMGEAFPNWYDSELALLLNPEAVLFGNPVALTAYPTDCSAATTREPLDRAFWVAGCWGSLYPFTGFFTPNDSPVRGSSLLATRSLALLSRLSLIKRTVGNDAACDAQFMPILKKSQYKMQMLFPVPETSGGSDAPGEEDTSAGGQQVTEQANPSRYTQCCHPIGQSTLAWGEWRVRPGTGEDFVYLLWQWTDCCMGISPGS